MHGFGWMGTGLQWRGDGERNVDGSLGGGGTGVDSRAVDRWIDSSGSAE
jgi:hypothetical protein